MVARFVSRFSLLACGLVCAVSAAPATPTAPSPTHELYICASMSGAFIIGSTTPRLNGLYRSADRQEINHVGFNHPRLDAVVADPRDPTVLFTAGLNGVMRSGDRGASWRIMTSWDMTEPKDLAIDPHRPDRIYIALPDGFGVSEDAGQTWRRSQSGIRRAYTQSVAVDRSEPGRIVIGTELGIYLSEDGAASWQKVLTTDATVTDVQQSPHDPDQFAAVTQRNGAWVSRDGGKTWQHLRALTNAHTLHNVSFDPHRAGRLVVSGWGLGVAVSEDEGRTWVNRTAGLPNPNVWRVSSDPDFPNRIYASVHEAPIQLSDDFGQTWKPHWFEGATVWDFAFVRRSTSSSSR